MDPKPKRPMALWIALTLLSIYGLIFVMLFAYGVATIEEWYRSRIHLLNGLAAGYFLGVFAILKRRNWARWACVGTLFVTVLVMLYIMFLDPESEPENITNWEELLVVVFGTALILSPFLGVVTLLTIGKRVHAFFTGNRDDAEDTSYSVPPPPPAFKP